MGTRRKDNIYEYADRLVRQLKGYVGVDLRIESTFDPALNSALNKRVIQDGNDKHIVSGVILVNFGRLTTHYKIRTGIAHEMAHLIPGTESFKNRWRLWYDLITMLMEKQEGK